MNTHIGLLGALAVAVNLVSAPFHRRESEPVQSATTPPCTADSSYQRLAFWVGDWDVFDSTGALYATQRVRAVLDECAITAEWTSSGGNKGMGLSAFDGKRAASCTFVQLPWLRERCSNEQHEQRGYVQLILLRR